MSGFPPKAASAINSSKNKRKKNKKKNKKQENVVPTPPAEGVSYAEVAALPTEEETVGSTNTSPNERSVSDITNDAATASDNKSSTNDSSAVDKHSATTKESLVPVDTNVIPTTGVPSFAEITAETPPQPSKEELSDVIKYSIQSVIASPSIHIYKIIDMIAKKVEAGEYNTSVPQKSKSSADISDSLPLSDTVKYGIQSVIASQCIDLYGIVDKISKKVQYGKYKSFELEYLNKSLPQVIAESAIAAVTSAVTGTAALISDKISTKNQLSENVEHCIQSTVNARSVDVYGIIESTNNLKCPEPAVGKTMPSSAKKADIVPQDPSISNVPQKKSDLFRRENKNLNTQRKSSHQRKKKKDCIIL